MCSCRLQVAPSSSFAKTTGLRDLTLPLPAINMEVDNITPEVNVQGENNAISIGNRTVHNNFIVNIENYHVSTNDSQQTAPGRNPSLPTSPGFGIFDAGENGHLLWQALQEAGLMQEAQEVMNAYATPEDVKWLADRSVSGCQSSQRTELYQHLDIDDQEVENIRHEQQLQGENSLEKEVFTILEHGLIKKERTRRYLLEKLYTFDPYLARSYMSFLAQVLLETLLEKLLAFQDVMWLTNKLVGGVCFNSVESLYHLFDIKDKDIDRIRSNYVRKEDSFFDEVFMILDYGLRRQKKKRRYVLENLRLLDEDLAHCFQEYLLSR